MRVVACSIVVVIIGILTLTGAASSFAGFILTVGETSLFLSLLLTMLVCLILGMGIPTIPNYIITSAIAAAATGLAVALAVCGQLRTVRGRPLPADARAAATTFHRAQG